MGNRRKKPTQKQKPEKQTSLQKITPYLNGFKLAGEAMKSGFEAFKTGLEFIKTVIKIFF